MNVNALPLSLNNNSLSQPGDLTSFNGLTGRRDATTNLCESALGEAVRGVGNFGKEIPTPDLDREVKLRIHNWPFSSTVINCVLK